eukprot:GFKZ01007553.1.p1 GENE.GFKZ01007553.1~~GFKZ01007553.1.p1  ORF type:complete len:457 (+),score=34.35 GFKZ01007553.1:135-1373(+)
MSPRQIPGTYTNLQLIPSTGFCPDQVRISQVEPLQTANATLFVIPHQFITLPILSAGLTPCTATPITPEQSNLFNTSATVLYRSSQIPLPENFDIIAQFRLASEQFFLAQEVGPRVCGLAVLPSATVSMWMAPDRTITASAGNQSLTFVPGFKYIFYFPESRPCLYRGNAAEMGNVVSIPSPSPTPSTSFIPSPSNVPTPSVTALPSQTALPSIPLSPSFSPIPVAAVVTPLPTEAPVCFAGGQRVRKEGGRLVPMEDVRVGDRVLVGVEGGRQYSRVFAWTHRQEVPAVFVRIETGSGRRVDVTAGHYVWVNGTATRAGQVRVGDWMVDEIWGRVSVTWVGCVVGWGLYSPQTVHGNLVVEGVVVTTYSSVAKEMAAAHALLAPLRFLERRVGGIVARVIGWLGVERASVG